LEDGVHVEVNKTGNDTFDFTLTSEQGNKRYLTIVDDDRPKDQIVEPFDFDQLNAVRRFWLETDDII